jgi:hypothetical protein
MEDRPDMLSPRPSRQRSTGRLPGTSRTEVRQSASGGASIFQHKPHQLFSNPFWSSAMAALASATASSPNSSHRQIHSSGSNKGRYSANPSFARPPFHFNPGFHTFRARHADDGIRSRPPSRAGRTRDRVRRHRTHFDSRRSWSGRGTCHLPADGEVTRDPGFGRTVGKADDQTR